MRSLLALVVGMGVLIVAGLLVVGVTIVHRLGGPEEAALRTPEIMLDEPAGTHIVGAAGYAGDRLAVTLQGGGLPDRVVLLDSRGGRVGTVRLGR